GWALFTRASLSNDLAYRFCQAIADRQDGIPWEETYENPGSLAMNNAAAPRDVPLHPGAARWYREHGFNVPD
ncbi:MAG TPA: TAXI family TRAP transporter solute-binding subunit, partial [Chloroflexota bacterium]|nr:TAXI family TRAP transporter solute-binding subunit [Chloroflexota bacterium]